MRRPDSFLDQPARQLIRLCLLLAASAVSVSAPAQSGGKWTGELTLTIRGQGQFDDGTIKARWNVDRVARATVVLDRSFRGGGIAGTESSSDTTRYETWVATRSQPAQIEVNDSGTFDGPFFHPRNFRLDTIRWTCPSQVAPTAGELRSSILQVDFKKASVTWEVPRLYTACDLFYRLEFPKGQPEWTRQPPKMNEEGVDRQFEVVHRLVVPKEWRHLTVPFVEGQTEIVLSRKLPFEWPLRTEKRRAPLEGELTLVLRKSP